MKTPLKTRLYQEKFEGSVALVSNSLWSLWNFRKSLIEMILREGFLVVLIAPQDKVYQEKFEKMGIVVHPLDFSSRSKNPFGSFLFFLRLFKAFRSYQVIFSLHYTIKPVLFASLVARLRSSSYVNMITGLGNAFLRDNWLKKLVMAMYKVLLDKRFPCIFLNEEDRQFFIKEKILKKTQALLFPGEGVDTDAFSPKEKTIKENFVFLLMARLIKEKGIALYAQAAEQIKREYPHARFTLLGPFYPDNPSALSLDDIQHWQDQGFLEYLGSSEDVRPFIAESDVVVLPSFYKEGLPRSLLEGASMGRILLASDIAGCRDCITSDFGYLFAPCDLESFVRHLRTILDLSEEERYHKGLLARKYIEEHFSEKKVLGLYRDLFVHLGLFPQ